MIAGRAARFAVLAPEHGLVKDNDVSNHRLILLATTVCISLGAACSHGESGWLNDYKRAQQEAKTNNKFLLLDFTGSDWCGWCKKLDKEILSQSQFKDYARENLVLLEVDFPRAKPQNAEVRKQNQELAQQYQVEGFPTIVVLNGDGQKLWKYDGYFPDGLAAFIVQLEKLRKG
ncbi:MAG: thioredoxin family protein [Verrucomicrobia bacterium]|nr:MAG: thioredoxin family protein [Verrucomicrobiota bacterium]